MAENGWTSNFVFYSEYFKGILQRKFVNPVDFDFDLDWK